MLQTILFGLCFVIALFVIVIYLLVCRVGDLESHIMCVQSDLLELQRLLKRSLKNPSAPPKPILLTEKVYQDMGKIYFPFMLPEVPSIGSPVKRIVTVFYDGEIVKEFDNVPLTKCILKLYPNDGVNVAVSCYTKDAAGNTSEASVATFKAEDVYPPPAPPVAQLLVDDLDEVEDDAAGEIEITEISGE